MKKAKNGAAAMEPGPNVSGTTDLNASIPAARPRAFRKASSSSGVFCVSCQPVCFRQGTASLMALERDNVVDHWRALHLLTETGRSYSYWWDAVVPASIRCAHKQRNNIYDRILYMLVSACWRSTFPRRRNYAKICPHWKLRVPCKNRKRSQIVDLAGAGDCLKLRALLVKETSSLETND